MTPEHTSGARGSTFLEVLFAAAVTTTLAALAVPLTTDVSDDLRATMATRYVAGRIATLRMEAVARSTAVALRFELTSGDYTFAQFADGNGNGVRTADIGVGTDALLGPAEQLRNNFRGVRFGLRPGIPDLDGTISTADSDGVRIGNARILTMSPDGTATPGTLYIRGTRRQYAVRVLGVTGRTRVFRFESGTQQWTLQ
jgi:type II secretory pathway pseudopilin PulG